jgi:hypothetical protein
MRFSRFAPASTRVEAETKPGLVVAIDGKSSYIQVFPCFSFFNHIQFELSLA